MDYTPSTSCPRARSRVTTTAPTIGPYDLWAIEYGYKPFSGGTSRRVERTEEDRRPERRTGPGLRDRRRLPAASIPIPSQPVSTWERTSVAYARLKAKLVGRADAGACGSDDAKTGEDYTRARTAFNVLLSKQADAMRFAARLRRRPVHQPQPQGRQGRQAAVRGGRTEEAARGLTLLEKEVFGVTAFQFPPDSESVGSVTWNHWGVEPTERPTTRCTTWCRCGRNVSWSSYCRRSPWNAFTTTN